jgi:hypothetical protein
LKRKSTYLGYVPDEDMSGIYAEAVALVMPTFFGPTNIPPLESWAFGRPVLSSDIRGIREQIGNAGVLVDPRSVEAIAEGIFRLWTNEHLCKELADRGRQRLRGLYPRWFSEPARGYPWRGQNAASFVEVKESEVTNLNGIEIGLMTQVVISKKLPRYLRKLEVVSIYD